MTKFNVFMKSTLFEFMSIIHDKLNIYGGDREETANTILRRETCPPPLFECGSIDDVECENRKYQKGAFCEKCPLKTSSVMCGWNAKRVSRCMNALVRNY